MTYNVHHDHAAEQQRARAEKAEAERDRYREALTAIRDSHSFFARQIAVAALDQENET